MRLSPLYIYRETHFPLAYVRPFLGDLGLEYERLMERLDDLVHEIHRLTSLMEAEIKLIPDDQDRRAAINFKRDLFNMRSSASDKFCLLQDAFSQETRVNIKIILNKLDQLSAEQAELHAEYEKTYLMERRWIQQVYHDDMELRNALILLNSAIFKNLEAYLCTDIDKHNRQLRKLDYVLLRFLTRAVMKTSPFANLTYSGVGSFSKPAASGRKRLYPRINDAILLRVFDRICLFPKIAEKLSYQLNDTLMEKEGKYYITVLKDGEKKRKLYKASQQLCVLPVNPAIASLFAELKKAEQLPYHHILECLNKNGVEKEKSMKLIFYLIENGVLERTLYMNGQMEDLVEELLINLRKLEFDHPCLSQLSRLQILLMGLRDKMGSYSCLEEVYQLIERVTRPFGLNFERRDMLYIDGIDETHQTQNRSGERNWQQPLADFEWMTMAFDVTLKMRYNASLFFKERYGLDWAPNNAQEMSGVLRDLAQALFFDQELFETGRGRFKEDSHFASDKANQLHQMARMIINHLKSQMGSAEISLDEDFVKPIVKGIQDVIGGELISHSFFVQCSEEKMVVNHIYKGYGMFFARFLKYLNFTDDDYESYVQDCFEDKGITDIRNTFGFNANLRKSVVKQAFQLPISTENGSDGALTWRDLGLKYNDHTNLLEFYEKQSGEVIRPQFLGTLTLLATPPILNVFDTLASHGTLYFDLGEVLIQEQLQAGVNQPVSKIPRVSMAEGNLVLSRAKWVIRTADLIGACGNVGKHFETWCKIVAFCAQHDIPRQFYLRPYTIDLSQMENLSDRKPQFINLSSPLLFHLLMQIIEKNDYILIEEELPAIGSDRNSVTEYIYEITHNGGEEQWNSKACNAFSTTTMH
ncbi:lantibiotic dehydratase [Paenibacillus azoreducens]|uniref:Lanthionine biosynthesis protein n=1 Tax=Paenibacillus azoreducens TaxID=116718 RepID=A0A920CRG7_9BACL|nr:lantibiotic dehydratase [Paenibacillus azoreducens]GIO46287.1 lanthionine biosynthesis protein [Paenibacillus azoreducens]